MYEEFYGFTRKPFSKTPDPRFLFLSRTHEEALARLQYAVEEKDIILLSGEIGCGKTTLTRALMDGLDEKECRVITLLNPRLTPAQFLRTVALRFGIKRPNRRRESLLEKVHEKVFEDYERGVTPVIIIDEAQLIPKKDTFEEIRLLTNFQLDDTNMLSLILVGQPNLRNRMDRTYYEPLRQRIGFFYHLGPLSEEEVKGYVEHRMKVAGRHTPLFTHNALLLLFRYSGGVPRVINSLAHSALLEGLGAGADMIEGYHVDAAAGELGLVG
jgi:type II secretory pathway predicted ATPase ExeA